MLENQQFIIFFDCDGTLIQDDQSIGEKTASYIKKLKDEGHKIVLASGRPPRAIIPYYEQLGLDTPIIAYNGLVLYDPETKKFVKEKRYRKELIGEFFDRFPEYMFDNFQSETDTELYFLVNDGEYENYFHKEGMNVHYGPFKNDLKDDVFSFVVNIKKEYLDKRQEMSDFVNTYDDIGMRFWYPNDNMGELYYYSANKSSKMSIIAKRYGLDRAHIIAFGDGCNDIEMIKKAGISFAMKNADPGLLESADYVTEYDNNHEGIYHALKKIFEGNL